jgi:hypothetical protein
VNFGMIVTATVLDPDKKADAIAAIDNLSATARLRLRVVYGSQDSAFAAALPLGLVLPAAPTGRVVEKPFKAKLTELGQKHPVTNGLPGAKGDEPLGTLVPSPRPSRATPKWSWKARMATRCSCSASAARAAWRFCSQIIFGSGHAAMTAVAPIPT